MNTPLKYKKKRLGSFHWKEGVWSSEVERSLSPTYAKRYRWLLRNRNQRLIVWLNIASWILAVFGTLDISWNLGFSGTPFSWWNLLVIVAYHLVRQSVRVVADAPDELLDERLIAERDRSYLIAYRWMIVITAFVIGALFGRGRDRTWFRPLHVHHLCSDVHRVSTAEYGPCMERERGRTLIQARLRSVTTPPATRTMSFGFAPKLSFHVPAAAHTSSYCNKSGSTNTRS